MRASAASSPSSARLRSTCSTRSRASGSSTSAAATERSPEDRRARRRRSRRRQFAGDGRGGAGEPASMRILMDAADMRFDEFDAAFSNAALHWMLEKDRRPGAIFRAPGRRPLRRRDGRRGQSRLLREALDDELIIRGYVPPLGAATGIRRSRNSPRSTKGRASRQSMRA